MADPKDRGIPGAGALEQLSYLQNKVREKNEIIADLEDRLKAANQEIINGVVLKAIAPFSFGVVMGVGFTWLGVWIVRSL